MNASSEFIQKTVHILGIVLIVFHLEASIAQNKEEPFSVRDLQWGKSISHDECLRIKWSVWVAHNLGEECIRYYPSPSLEQGLNGESDSPKTAVFFFHGDHLAGTMPLGNYDKISEQTLLHIVQKNEETYKVAYILVARPGVYGSSGRHNQRRREKEFQSMSAAVDAIKLLYGIERVVLAGQSGGSTVASALLTLGRKDVMCAAMGSGNYAVNALAEIKRAKLGQASRRGCDVTNYCDAYDVIEHVQGIAHDEHRDIYVIGDPQDQNTIFELQRAFYEKLIAAGHKATLIEVEGRGPERHSTAYVTYRVAAMCAKQELVPNVLNTGYAK